MLFTHGGVHFHDCLRSWWYSGVGPGLGSPGPSSFPGVNATHGGHLVTRSGITPWSWPPARTVPPMHPTITINGRTISAPPGAFAFVDDGGLGRWIVDLDEAQRRVMDPDPAVRWVEVDWP